jgi:hypothetical protein
MITALGAACKANFSFISSLCNLNLNWHPAPKSGQSRCDFKDCNLQSPQEIGSYFGGFVSEVHEGMTPSTQLKFRPSIQLVAAVYVK